MRTTARLNRSGNLAPATALEIALVPHGTAYHYASRYAHDDATFRARFAFHYGNTDNTQEVADIARTLAHELVHIAYKSPTRRPANRISDEATATIIGHCAQVDAGGPKGWHTAAVMVTADDLDRLNATPLDDAINALSENSEALIGYMLGKNTLRELTRMTRAVGLHESLFNLCDYVATNDIDFTTTHAKAVVTAALPNPA